MAEDLRVEDWLGKRVTVNLHGGATDEPGNLKFRALLTENGNQRFESWGWLGREKGALRAGASF